MPNAPERLQTALAGRYDVERELASGGMATVYLARDVKHDRRVALKVLHPELSPYGYRPDRFLREIRIVAGLTHPQILPLHDSGQCDEYLFYVMPYVEGESLRDRLRREKQLPLEEALGVARAVAGALDYAHRHDVLHRDVKPENVLLHEGQALVTDFGIARAISECCDDLTEAGLAVGTPAYMSPEQASGDDELDGRSDIYSLGCMLFEMLTGQPPFEGASARHTMAMHAVEAVPSVRSRRPDVPSPVDAAIGKALAKDPKERFGSAAEFAGELDALRKAAAGFAGAQQPDGRPRSIAVLPFENLNPDPDTEYFSDGITDELINALAKVDGLSVTSRTSVFAIKGARRDVRSLGALLGVSAVIEGTVRQAGDTIRITARLTDVADGRHLWSERYDRRMDDVFAVQDEIAQTIVRALRRTMLRDIGEPAPLRYTKSVEAYNLYLKGRFHWNRRTSEAIDEAIRHFEQAIALDPGFAPAYAGLADSHAIRTDYRGLPVAEGMERAKLEARKALELDDSLAEAHTSLAWVTFIYDWNWEAADRGFRRAEVLNPGYATARQWHAWLHLALGRFDEAIEEARAALALDPVSISVRRSVGWIHYYTDNLDAAVRHLKRAVEMDPTAAENQRVLGRAYLKKGKVDEATAAFTEAIALSRQSAYALADLGYLHAVLDETAEARRILDALHATAEQHYVSPVAFVTLYAGLGAVDEAFQWLHKAYDERRGWLAYINVEPVLDPLRGDHRFADLVRMMGLNR